LNAGLDLTRCKSELALENALPRQQLIALESQGRMLCVSGSWAVSDGSVSTTL